MRKLQLHTNIDLDIDLNNFCRICLNHVNESTDLFSESDESEKILKTISECFQIVFDSEKYMPCAICKICVEELNNANKFRLKCVNINETFKDYCEKFLQKSLEKAEEIDTNNIVYSDESQSSQPAFNDEEPNQVSINIVDRKSNFKCDICNKVLKSTKSLLNHVLCMHEKRKHVGKVSGFGSARRYHCTTCSYSTPHSQTLVNHMRRHNGERPYSCECGKNFTQVSSLAAHRKTHSTSSFFTCSQCGKQFKHSFSLKTHLRVHADGTFCCSICTKVLKSKETLQAHMRRHYKIYNFNCEDCGDTFVTSVELNNHRLKHNKEKKIQCHICDYTTNTRKSLAMHIKRHVGEKEFKCNFCERAFYTQGYLRRHMRVHTREKPFPCTLCTQRFTYSSSLNKHMLTVHGVQYKWADVKWKESRTDNIIL